MICAHLESHGRGTPHGRPIFGGELGSMRRAGGCASLRNGNCLGAEGGAWIQT